MMKYTTETLRASIDYREAVLDDPGGAYHVMGLGALNYMELMERSLIYCWRELRGKTGVATKLLEYTVCIETVHYVTTVTISKEDEYVSFAGGANGTGVRSQSMNVYSIGSLRQFAMILDDGFVEGAAKGLIDWTEV